jgi:membrane-associated phospholipid phosphatase
MDQHFADWYQQDVRSAGTDHFASFWKPFGEGKIFIPAFAGLAVAGRLMDEYPVTCLAGEYGSRVTRSYLVGFPSMLFLQRALGPSRPSEPDPHSQWRPFSDSHGVSGHAFMGSIPFITAARMTDNPWVAGTLYVCSTFTGWSRINDNQHYLSQVVLGWWMGYLACRSVSETQEAQEQAVSFAPLVSEQGVGVMVMCRL